MVVSTLCDFILFDSALPLAALDLHPHPLVDSLLDSLLDSLVDPSLSNGTTHTSIPHCPVPAQAEQATGGSKVGGGVRSTRRR